MTQLRRALIACVNIKQQDGHKLYGSDKGNGNDNDNDNDNGNDKNDKPAM